MLKNVKRRIPILKNLACITSVSKIKEHKKGAAWATPSKV
jgi:hypothetical protein